MASLRTRPSAADPSHPVKRETKFMFLSQTARTLNETSPFLFRYLGLSVSGTRAWMYVPSNAPKHPYEPQTTYDYVHWKNCVSKGMICVLCTWKCFQRASVQFAGTGDGVTKRRVCSFRMQPKTLLKYLLTV